MKKISLLIFVIFLSFSFSGYAQCGAPLGISLTSQAAVDNYSVNYPGCTTVIGYLSIGGDNISNLNGLSQITVVTGSVAIQSNLLLPDYNYPLTDISGLYN